MIDVNEVLSRAFNEAVESAVAPLRAQVQELAQLVHGLNATYTEDFARVQQDLTTITQPALEATIEFLDRKEWFWAKIQNFISKEVDNLDFDDRVKTGLQWIDITDYVDMKSEVESVLEDFDFSDVLDVSEIVKSVKEGLDLEEAVREALDGQAFTISL